MSQQTTSYLLSDWQSLYQGVDYASGAAVNALDVYPAVTRIQHVNVLRIQLSAPGVGFFTTPKGDQFAQTVGQTITGFLTSHPSLRVAVNANLSWFDVDQPGGNFSLLGLAMSQGKVVCDPTKPAPQPTPTTEPDVPDQTYAGAMALLITEDNQVSFQLATAENPVDTSGYYTAIAGSNNSPPGWPPQKPYVAASPLLIDSTHLLVTPSADPPEGVAGRTGAALSYDGQSLYLLTIDGREGNDPPYGGSFYDLARWFQLVSDADPGISNALNLDGGGSTVMARSDLDENGEPYVTLISVPYGDEHTPGLERVVGNFLGVSAAPLAGPPPVRRDVRGARRRRAGD